MLSDIEIASQASMQTIDHIADAIGILPEELEPYGRYKAKLSEDIFRRTKDLPDGKLVLVTAINPTPAGEGKTTTTVGLGQYRPAGTLPGAGVRCQGRRRRRRLRPGGAHGGHQPALHRGYARHHRRQQPAVRHYRQSHPAGQRPGH